MIFERLSLRKRLLLSLLVPVLALTGLWAFATYNIILHFADLAYDRALEDSVLTLAGQVAIDQSSVSINLPPAAQTMLEFDQVDRVYYTVSDNNGHALAGNHGPLRQGVAEVGVTRFFDIRVDGRVVRLAEYGMQSPTDHSRSIIVRVGETVRKREILASEALLFMIAPQFLFVFALSVMIWIGIGRAMAPLQRIRDAIAHRTHEDLRPIAEVGLPAEVHEQVHVINGLMERLRKVIDLQRRFVADAAHQLRTPITVLKTQSSLALDMESSPPLHALLEKMDSTTTRLARLGNQLLNLSRAEAYQAKPIAIETVNVVDIVQESVAELIQSALRRGIEVRVETPEMPVWVHGDRQLLTELVSNLVDNAFRYTLDHDVVSVTLHVDQEFVTIVVADNGPGISIDKKARVFEPFYRGSNARSDGSGLGLAIAREIVDAHRGRIALHSTHSDGHGLVVTVKIPVQANSK